MIQFNSISKPTTSIKIQVLAEIEFGVPSKKCRNFGICRINLLRKKDIEHTIPFNRNGHCKTDRVGGVITLLENGNTEISFLKYDIRKYNKQKYFVSNKFLIQEDTFLLIQDHPRIEMKIKKGEYPIKKTETFISVFFKK